MAKNRKYQPAAIRFGPALKAFLLCLLIGGAGVGYVWQKNQIYQLGQQIKLGETRRDLMAAQNKKLEKQLQSMRTPVFLEQRIKDLNLGLVAPPASQVWRLPEPLRDSPGAAVERGIAVQDQRAPATQ